MKPNNPNQQIGYRLREEGFVIGNRKIEESSAVVITNILLKTIKTIKTIENSTRISPRKTSSNLDSFDSFDSFSPKFKEKTLIIDKKVSKVSKDDINFKELDNE